MYLFLKIFEGVFILGGIAFAIVGIFVPHRLLYWAKQQTRLGAVAFGVCVTFLGSGFVSLFDKHNVGILAAASVAMILLVAALMSPPK
jgi:hypothetical protein